MGNKCPIESTISIIGGKWKILIFKELTQGPKRYGEIKKNIEVVSAKVLTQQLREMENDGLIKRDVVSQMPPYVEYSLDKMGLSIFNVFSELRRWGAC